MMKFRNSVRIACAALIAAGALSQLSAQNVTLTIRPDSNYQTFEGMGAHGSMDVWWSNGPFYNAAFLDLVVDNMGMTMNRNEFYPDYEPTNDNGDPNVLGTFNQNGIFVNKQKAWINALKAKAEASGEPMRFIASYWSPPAWMKQNSSTTGTDPATNILRTGVEAELGEFGVATIKAYKDHCGVDLYALSLQNEPAFPQTFNSCVYTPTRYRDVFKIFGQRVKTDYPNVKLFGAEHMLANWGTFEGQLSSDPVARSLIDAFAVHGYSDGVNPTSASQAVSYWKRAATNSASAGKALWMTETSGYTDSWTDAYHVAESIYAAIRHGRLAAWVWWQLSEPANNQYAMMNSGQPSKRMHVHKQFARWIRPGAVMVGAPTTGDTLVFTAAFHHKTNRTLSIVLLNSNNASRTVTLATSAGTLPQFTVFRTSATENSANVGTATTSVTLPASTLTTLYATNYDPPTPVIDPQTGRVNPAALAMVGDARIYSLDGRLVRTVHETRINNGRVSWDGRDANGRTVSQGTYYAMVTDKAGRIQGNRLPVDIGK